MLYIKLIILNWTKRQIEANSDCPEHNGTDINRPQAYMRTSRHFNRPISSCINLMYNLLSKAFINLDLFFRQNHSQS